MRHSSRFGISQNFLRHPSLVDRLIQNACLAPGELVLDLGAGSGAITERLVRHGCRVVAVEADPCLGYPLRDRFAGCDAVEVRVAEIARHQLPRGPYKVFANIPFTITAAVIELLTSAGRPPEDAYLVVQREAAQRFLGRPRPTMVAALLAPWFELSVEHRFRRWDFAPSPGVEPVLLRLRKRGPPLIHGDRRRRYRDFVVAVFGAPCPIQDSIRQLLGADAALRLGREVRLEPLVRPAQLDVERWPALFTAFDGAASRQTHRYLAGAEARLRRQQRRLDKRHRTRVARQVHPGETSEGRPPPARRMWRDDAAPSAQPVHCAGRLRLPCRWRGPPRGGRRMQRVQAHARGLGLPIAPLSER
jgi:23S rRNA (adenine-N6)-dimethyltransferase